MSALDDMRLLFDYLDAMGSLPFIIFDLSLARGLDYYTGVIYEAVLVEGTIQLGSISAGGRYDNLVGMFSSNGMQTPCVGVSIGVERVFTILEKKAEENGQLSATDIQVYIASIGAGYIPQRMRIAQKLWHANIAAEYSYHPNPKLKRQLDETLERNIPFMVVFGETEVEKGVVNLKAMGAHIEEEVPLDNLVARLLELGAIPVTHVSGTFDMDAAPGIPPASGL
jgi:histidyl-tRNA synthetase